MTMNVRRCILLGWGASAACWSALAGTDLPAARVKLETFDYRGVRLLDSRWLTQFKATRDYYLGVADDDILHGYRVAAGLPAPGQPLGGWCAKNSDPVFG